MDIDSNILGSDVVLMCGISGSGKTFFARCLEGHGFVRLSVDEIIWAKYGDAFASLPFPEQQPIFQNANRMLCEELERLIAAGKKVVVDSTMCKRAKRDNMRALCRKLGVEPVFVYLDVPLEELRRRMAGRKGDGPNDQIISPEQLEMFFANFEKPGCEEGIYTVKREG